MITIRRLTFELPDNGDTLLTHIKLDTEKIKFRLGDYYFRWWTNFEKPWTGEIKNKEFKIIRSRTGLLKLGLSRILLKGQINTGDKKTTIELKVGLPRTVIVSFLWELIFVIALIFYIQDIWGLLIIIALLTIEVLIIISDMNKTEVKFTDYLERLKSNEPQQNA